MVFLILSMTNKYCDKNPLFFCFSILYAKGNVYPKYGRHFLLWDR